MNKISVDDVKKLAQLSALAIKDEDIPAMQTDLEHILSYVDQLQALSTENITPTYQAHSLETVTRSDVEIDYAVSQADLLKNAPMHRDGSIVVPRVIE